jgi:ribosomal-protein-alanine N-acetyltransferase
MSLFRAVNSNEPPLTVTAEKVTLRLPQMADYEEWAALREESRDFLVPWEPTWPVDDLTRSSYRRRMRRYSEDQRNDLSYPYFIFSNEDQKLVGGLTLTNVRRGVAQAASLGYWMGAPYSGQGYMSAAVRALVPFAFATLKLHRIEAACIPENAASVHLLERTAFVREGYARAYLCINGTWQDHLLYAQVRSEGHPVRF